MNKIIFFSVLLLAGCTNSKPESNLFRKLSARQQHKIEYCKDFSSVIQENSAQKHAEKMANDGNVSFSGIVKYGPIYEFVYYGVSKEKAEKIEPNPTVFRYYPELLDSGVAYSEKKDVWFACKRYGEQITEN